MPPAADSTGAADAPPGAGLLAAADKAHALPDGRALTYIDCGDSSSGDAVLFLHPVQGNRWALCLCTQPSSPYANMGPLTA